jgi:hypothetical protein
MVDVVGGEALSESVSVGWSVLDCLKAYLGVGSRSGLSRPSLVVYY